MIWRLLIWVVLLSVIPKGGQAWLIQSGTVDSGKQLLVSNASSALSGAADSYMTLVYTSGANASAYVDMLFPFAGNIKSLKTLVKTTPSSGKTWDFTLYLNGSPTSATCQVTSATAGGICDWTGSVSFSAGDYGIILVHPSGTPSNSLMSFEVGITPSNAGDTIIAGAPAPGQTFSPTVANNYPAYTGTVGGVLSFKQVSLMPDSGTIDDLYVQSVAPGTLGSGKSYTYVTLNNNTATALTTVISETATTNHDTSHSYSVAAGDFFNFKGTPTSSPTASDAAYGVRFVPTTSAAYPYIAISGGGNSPSNSATRYMSITGTPSTYQTAVGDAQSAVRKQSFLTMVVKTDTAPGAAASGKKFTIALQVNGSASTLTCDVVETAKTCSVTSTVAVNDNDLVNISYVPTGTPTTGAYGVALLATR